MEGAFFGALAGDRLGQNVKLGQKPDPLPNSLGLFFSVRFNFACYFLKAFFGLKGESFLEPGFLLFPSLLGSLILKLGQLNFFPERLHGLGRERLHELDRFGDGNR